MQVGDIVRIKPLENPGRDLLYGGFIGTITQIAQSGACYVDSDGPGKPQAVSFREWFDPPELESAQE